MCKIRKSTFGLSPNKQAIIKQTKRMYSTSCLSACAADDDEKGEMERRKTSENFYPGEKHSITVQIFSSHSMLNILKGFLKEIIFLHFAKALFSKQAGTITFQLRIESDYWKFLHVFLFTEKKFAFKVA